MKTENTYRVALYVDGQKAEILYMYGATFFLPRARLCADCPDVDPHDVRLDPPRKYDGGR